jgi:creatinine amidohydrolase
MRSLADSTWPDAEKQRDRVLVVPVGATEQHGPHLPLTTDTDIAVALAQRLADALPDVVVVAPAVAYGSSGEHEAFAGTISIGQAATEHLLIELGRSATRTWSRVLLVSAHGGNAEPVARATRRLQDEGRDVRAWTPPWHDAHAGHSETSVMLALAPGRVDAAAAEAGATAPLAQLLPVLMERGVAAVSPNGVLGDPEGAGPDAGAQLLEAALASLRAAVLDPPRVHVRSA